MITLSVVPMTKLAKVHYTTFNEDIPTGAKSLSTYLMSATIDAVSNELDYTDYHNGKFKVLLDRHRLVKKPGYEILITDVDDVSFSIKKDFVFMTVLRNSKRYTYMIGECYAPLDATPPKEDESDEEKVQADPQKS